MHLRPRALLGGIKSHIRARRYEMACRKSFPLTRPPRTVQALAPGCYPRALIFAVYSCFPLIFSRPHFIGRRIGLLTDNSTRGATHTISDFQKRHGYFTLNPQFTQLANILYVFEPLTLLFLRIPCRGRLRERRDHMPSFLPGLRIFI